MGDDARGEGAGRASGEDPIFALARAWVIPPTQTGPNASDELVPVGNSCRRSS